MPLSRRAICSATLLLATSSAVAAAQADAPPLAWSTNSLTLDTKSADACAPTVVEKFVRYAVVPIAAEPAKRHALVVQRFEVGSGCFEGFKPARANVYAKTVDVRTGKIGDKPLWSFETGGIGGEVVSIPAGALYRVDMPGCCGATKTEKYFSLRTGKLVASSTGPLLSLYSKDREGRFVAVEDGIASSRQGQAGAMATLFYGDADGVRETLAITVDGEAGRSGWAAAELSWKGQEPAAALGVEKFSGASLQLLLHCQCDADPVHIEIPIDDDGFDERNAHVTGMAGIVLTRTMRGAAPQQAAVRAKVREATPEAVAQDFFNYLLQRKTNIATDASAQNAWLTASLRKQLADTAALVRSARKSPAANGPDPAVPDNGVFLDSWDYPTRCRVTDAAMPPGRTQAQVELLCEWGARTNYPGATRTARTALTLEDGSWRVANIRMQKSRYAEEADLLKELESLRSQSVELLQPAAEPR